MVASELAEVYVVIQHIGSPDSVLSVRCSVQFDPKPFQANRKKWDILTDPTQIKGHEWKIYDLDAAGISSQIVAQPTSAPPLPR